MFVFSPKLPLARSARLGASLPLPLARFSAACTWACFYALDIMQLRSTLQPTIRKALQLGGIKSHLVGVAGAIAFGRYIVDFSFFLTRSGEAIRHRVQRRTSLRGTDHLVQALQGGKGAILVSSNFACFYYALATSHAGMLPEGVEVVIVQPQYSVDHPEARRFKEKLSGVMGRELRIIESGTLRAGIEMTAALKRGCVVACLVDFFPPKVSSFAITQFLNQPSCQPTGLAAIAVKNAVAVVPCFTFFEKGRFVTEFMPALAPGANENKAEQVLSLCTRIDAALSEVIMRRPAEWAGWLSVPLKWHTAAALLDGAEA